jgi:hypothetical protein
MKNQKQFFLTTAISFLMLFTLISCEALQDEQSRVSLTFSKDAALYKSAVSSIELDTVKILLRDIKIKNQNGKDSVNIKAGPFVVFLNMIGATTDFAIGDIPPGTFDRVKFEVHKLEASENPPDPEFKDGADESLRYSVIVKGKYNNVPFVYKSRKSAHQDLKLMAPVSVNEGGFANLTIIVDPYTWFVKNNTELDPSKPENENDIDNNIKDSFKRAFKDNNYDGSLD